MQELYRINVKSGNFKDDYTVHTKDKRVLDFINEKGGFHIKEIPGWFSFPEDFEHWDDEPSFWEFMECVHVLFPEYPYVLLEETDLIEIN